MKYKHCPDCGDFLVETRAKDGWATDYDCPNCSLNIHISFGETMHAAPDIEKWTRKEE